MLHKFVMARSIDCKENMWLGCCQRLPSGSAHFLFVDHQNDAWFNLHSSGTNSFFECHANYVIDVLLLKKQPVERIWFIVKCILAFHWICFPLLAQTKWYCFLHCTFVYFHKVNAFLMSLILSLICFCFSILMQFNLFDTKGIKNKRPVNICGKAS